MIASLTWWQFGLLWLPISVLLAALWSWHRYHQKRLYNLKYRRYVDCHGSRLKDLEAMNAGPGEIVGFELEDGFPGAPRGKIWSERKRNTYRRDRMRRKLRIVQDG